MKALRKSPLDGGILALAATAAALLVSLLLRPLLEPNIFLLFLAAVWVSAWLYGRAAGFAATAASAFAAMYFFLRPELRPAAPGWGGAVRLAIFILMAALITWITASWRDSRRLLSSTLSSIGDAVLAADREGRVTFLNPAAETLLGWPLAEARGKAAAEILNLAGERSHEALEDPIGRVLRERSAIPIHDHAILTSRNGAAVPIEHGASPVRDGQGRVTGAILVFRDISKRRQLEEQAAHAQKMEAVGRLAGGVAGDFNNVLTVITGYAELLRAEIPSQDALRRFVDEIIYAGERAAALTRHLLAFSGGSSAQPRVMDINGVLNSLEPMLHRLLGQNIELILLTTPGLGRVKADPSQIEQVMVNLATNARDAMPNGGKLVIETANADLSDASAKNLGVKPGSYVMVAVSDTGVGMDPETRSRLFEPFFTTKAPGKGSGLGLATVYGAIKQNEGQVTVYSQPDCGTIFEIYLPRVKDVLPEPAQARLARGSETILLVDDEEGVRKLVYAVLKSHGYDVLEADNGAAALATYEKNAHKIDMVITDVVMPQMSGFELGRLLADRGPRLKVLYMSGYRDNAIGAVTSGEGPPRAFLYKPFTPDGLLGKVREVLDARPV